MPHVQRNRLGDITSLHRDAEPGTEFLPGDHPDVRGFLARLSGASNAAKFATLDGEFVRVVEDVIDALLARNLIRITDLPSEAQHKLFERKNFREGLRRNALQLYAGTSALELDMGVVPIGTLTSAPASAGRVTHLGLRSLDDDVL
jgi:hypothetical protein